MPENRLVEHHYTHGSLTDAIRAGVDALGKTVDSVHIDDLAAVDEFHIGGRLATRDFLDQLGIHTDQHVLDVGCGLGGSSRFAAHTYGCRVTGVDLTREYIETGNELCAWVGLGHQVSLEVEDAVKLSHPDNTFHCAFMLHVGMNIADKASLATELHRVVQPGGKVGIYDVMKQDAGTLTYPVPWATEADGSAVAAPGDYRAALESAGFRVIAERNRRDFALDFFAQLQAKSANAGGPPPLGIHILMGETAPLKIRNMIENISRNLIAPVEIICEKPA